MTTVHLEIYAHSSMNRTRKAKDRSSKGDGKGSDDGSAEGTPRRTAKSPSGQATKPLRINLKKVVKRGNWDQHLESSRQDPQISETQTLQHPGKDPSNGPCASKKWQGHRLGHCTRPCTISRPILRKCIFSYSVECSDSRRTRNDSKGEGSVSDDCK